VRDWAGHAGPSNGQLLEVGEAAYGGRDGDMALIVAVDA